MTASEYSSPVALNLDSAHHGRFEPALAREGVYQAVDPLLGVRLGGAHQQVAIECRIDLGQVQSAVDPLLEQTARARRALDQASKRRTRGRMGRSWPARSRVRRSPVPQDNARSGSSGVPPPGTLPDRVSPCRPWRRLPSVPGSCRYWRSPSPVGCAARASAGSTRIPACPLYRSSSRPGAPASVAHTIGVKRADQRTDRRTPAAPRVPAPPRRRRRPPARLGAAAVPAEPDTC